ncbi:MAG: hypothetical protein F6J90_41765 [Moorea sp. SIOASIH]|uniref:hypothetical protein n=1 Tax=Moorena sp. SIOASIH TaxID=2607817 RepID=UPI0013B9CA50|nr:hypothetical protein [Moorena sp. SIOASIH]NEO42500.1 hypothetical protein [Moorena sp. SIOASIH]
MAVFLLVANYQLRKHSAISHQLSAISYQPLALAKRPRYALGHAVLIIARVVLGLCAEPASAPLFAPWKPPVPLLHRY